MARMHEILGVEPGELFRIPHRDKYRLFYVDCRGDLCEVENCTDVRRGSILQDAINHGIIRRPRYTPEQVEQLKALKVLGFEKGWMAKDKDGEVCAHKVIPYKNIDYWISAGNVTTLPDCGLVSWSDTEPLSIAQALKDAEVEG